jgi:hypothetical protein
LYKIYDKNNKDEISLNDFYLLLQQYRKEKLNLLLDDNGKQTIKKEKELIKAILHIDGSLHHGHIKHKTQPVQIQTNPTSPLKVKSESEKDSCQSDEKKFIVPTTIFHINLKESIKLVQYFNQVSQEKLKTRNGILR